MTSTPPDGVHRELKRLTSLRAVAALVVFGYHIHHFTSWSDLSPLFANGFVGVAFFFILSGFVLTWSTRPDVDPRTFLVRRFARVYPSHLLLALVALAVPFTSQPITPTGTVANLLLIQAWFVDWTVAFSLNGVSWSLSCEMFFYLCAPFLIGVSRRMPTSRAVLSLGAWAFAMSVVAVIAARTSVTADVYAYTNPLVRSGEFVLGVLLALLVERGFRPRLPLSAAVVAVAALAVLLFGRVVPQSVVDVLFVPLFAMVVFSAALADVAGRRGVLEYRVFTYAGQVSFAFYLVHALVILNLAGFVGSDASPKAGAVWVTVAFTVSVLLAVAVHEWFEKPAQRAIRRRWEVRLNSGA